MIGTTSLNRVFNSSSSPVRMSSRNSPNRSKSSRAYDNPKSFRSRAGTLDPGARLENNSIYAAHAQQLCG